MDWESKKKAWASALTLAFLVYLPLTMVILLGQYRLWEKVVCIIGLVILLIWMISAYTDILTGGVFGNCSFYVSGGIGTGEAMNVLRSYLHAQGANVVDDEDLANFRITLVSRGPDEFLCWLRDTKGYEKSVRKSYWNWPRPIALEISKFIRESYSEK